jgi:hypothetical protein
VLNYVRCVRGGGVTLATLPSPSPTRTGIRYNVARFRTAGQVSALFRNSRWTGCFRKRTGIDGGLAGGEARRFIRRLDRDGDNRVSRSEFDGPPERFDFHDADNGDGT